MKLTLQQLVNAVPALQRLNVQPVKALVAFHLSKISWLVDSELKAYDEARVKLLKELGRPKADNPQQYELGANADKFVRQLNEVLEQEIELDIKPILFEDVAQIELSSRDATALGWLIVDSGGETK